MTGDSDGNTISHNDASDGGDGIYVGCCVFREHFGPIPTAGANGNVVRSNTANYNSRYGIAQVIDNGGNTYKGNTANGNGVTDYFIEP